MGGSSWLDEDGGDHTVNWTGTGVACHLHGTGTLLEGRRQSTCVWALAATGTHDRAVGHSWRGALMT